MAISMDQIKELREATGVSMTLCKKALEESNGDLVKSVEYLRKQGAASNRADRVGASGYPKCGVVQSYIHGNGRMGTIVHIGCETDFVANSPDFQAFVKDVAMHITAANPLYLNPEDVSAELIEKEIEIWKDQLMKEKKPEAVVVKIMEGKEKKFREEISLLTQLFVKDTSKTIGDLLNDMRVKLGENIQICRFTRYGIQ
ncbi:MAG: elongation factor Ts, elongation factor Ts [Candidatus Peregrinibacteria bacterium GW2011_GWC2_39_14]|nr:MAG: elongation factor Ts, elongation factor Ts [Candidatus Peregrinibacteria bacterium GW2011_GWC2_39_14]